MRILILFLLLSLNIKAQTFQWAKGFNSSAIGGSIKTDASGNVYSIGEFYNTCDFDPGPGVYNLSSVGGADIYISKLDANGNFVWTKSIGGIYTDYAYSITLDISGNIYFTGNFLNIVDFDTGPGIFNMTGNGSYTAFICKLDNNGNFLWAKKLEQADANSGFSVMLDSAANPIYTGYFQGTADFDPGPGVYTMSSGFLNLFICKLNHNGNFVWAFKTNDTLASQPHYSAMDKSGYIYYIATAQDNNIDSYIIISKTDQNGNMIWTKRQYGICGKKVKGISVDSNGNVYGAGFSGIGNLDLDPGPGLFNVNGPAPFLFKLDANGNFVWGEQVSGDECSIVGDQAGNIYNACSQFANEDCDPGVGVYNLGGQTELFLRKLDHNGNFLWAKSFVGNGNGNGTPYGICLDTIGNIYTTGRLNNGDIDFDPGPNSFPLLTTSAFILKLNECGGPFTTLNYDFCDSITIGVNTFDYSVNFVQTYSDVNGCDSNVVFNLNNNSPGTYITTNGATFSASTSGAVYQWLRCNPYSIITGETNQTFVATLSGEYAVAITKNGCTDTSVCEAVTVTTTDNLSASENIWVYPNPVSEKLTMHLNEQLQKANIKILDITGQVLNEYTQIETSEFIIDMSSFIKGIYFIVINDDKNVLTKKILKE